MREHSTTNWACPICAAVLTTRTVAAHVCWAGVDIAARTEPEAVDTAAQWQETTVGARAILADLLARLLPAPWLPGPGNNDGVVRVEQPWGWQVVADCEGSEVTAEFIAGARNLLPGLLNDYAALTARLAVVERERDVLQTSLRDLVHASTAYLLRSTPFSETAALNAHARWQVVLGCAHKLVGEPTDGR